MGLCGYGSEGDMPLPTVKRGQHADRQSHRAAIAIGKQLHAIEELKRKVDAARLAGLRRVVLSPENAEDWHALPNAQKCQNCALVSHRIGLLLGTGKGADVHFLVGREEEKEHLSAHKLILASASEVFEAMFRFDEENETRPPAKKVAKWQIPLLKDTAARDSSAAAGNEHYPVVVPDVRIKRLDIVGSWRWVDGKEDACGICRTPFETCCMGLQIPGRRMSIGIHIYLLLRGWLWILPDFAD
ncbi:hypothetical protein niasHT_036324 [Heterodera trifolii]|uniref:BTB domain-containing protein n=1 Tax=Heterodera trifolii TaxID=157864 RepID=A0ABD2IWZ5_9BILA